MKKAILMTFAQPVRVIVETDKKGEYPDEYVEKGFIQATEAMMLNGAFDCFISVEEDFEIPYNKEEGD